MASDNTNKKLIIPNRIKKHVVDEQMLKIFATKSLMFLSGSNNFAMIDVISDHFKLNFFHDFFVCKLFCTEFNT